MICSWCGGDYTGRARPGGRPQRFCSDECVAASYRTDDPDRAWRWTLVREHRITVEEYNALLDKQGGVCAICGRPPKHNRLSVDHDHACCSTKYTCGKCIRGLLCPPCNRHLGYFEKFNKEIWKYLERSINREATS